MDKRVNFKDPNDWIHPPSSSTSLVDLMKPHQLLFNRRQAGEKLTDEENAILDAGFPVQQAYNEFLKELSRITELNSNNLLSDGWKKTWENYDRAFSKEDGEFMYFLNMGRYDKAKGTRDDSGYIDLIKIKRSDMRDGPTQGRFEGYCYDINFFRQIVKAI